MGLNIFFLIGVISAVLLTPVFRVPDMDIVRWRDIEAAIIFPASVIAFILGIIAIKKKDYTVLVYSSVAIGLLTILFVLLHSLFISD